MADQHPAWIFVADSFRLLATGCPLKPRTSSASRRVRTPGALDACLEVPYMWEGCQASGRIKARFDLRGDAFDNALRVTDQGFH